MIGRRREKLDETVEAIGAAGGVAFAIEGDVRDAPGVERAMREIAARAGRIDVLVNNAAGNFVCPSEELSPNGFKSVVDIVLLGTFHCTRFAFEALRESRGSIVNIVAAYAWSGEPGAVHSASAKAGVLATDADAGGRVGTVRHPRQCRVAGTHSHRGDGRESLERRRRRGGGAKDRAAGSPG